jgi:predicted DNA-binding WGR domain protein
MSTKNFRLVNIDYTFSWSITINKNILIIEQGRLDSELQKVTQEFESPEAATLAMQDLIQEKIKFGYVEIESIDGSSNDTIKLIPRRAVNPEFTSAQPTHLRQIKSFKVSTPSQSYYSYNGIDESEFILFHFQSDQFNLISLGINEYEHSNFKIKEKVRFVQNFNNTRDAQKVFNKIKSLKDLLDFIIRSKLEVTNRAHSKFLLSFGSEQIIENISSVLEKLMATKKLTIDVKEKTYGQISDRQYQKKIFMLKEGIISNKEIPKEIFTAESVRHLAQRVTAGEVGPDDWANLEGDNFNLSDVSPEAMYLFALAHSGMRFYGFWVYVKQIIKALEVQQDRSQILASFYSYYQNENIEGKFESVDFMSAHFGFLCPSADTQRYMMRRGRRYLAFLKQTYPEKYVRLSLNILKIYKPKAYQDRSIESHWIVSSIIYSQSWVDLNHGRKIRIPAAAISQNTLQISEDEKDLFLNNISILLEIFNNQKSIEITTFAFQLLNSAGHKIEIKKDRIKHLLNTQNQKLLSEVWGVIDSDVNILIDIADYDLDIFIRYCNKPDAKILDLLNALLESDMSYWLKEENVSAILQIIFDKDPKQALGYIQTIFRNKNWNDELIRSPLLVDLLVQDYQETIKLIGIDVIKNRSFVAEYWINSFSKIPPEKITKEILDPLTPFLIKCFGTRLVISQGIHQNTSLGLIELINRVQESNKFGAVAKLFFGYAKNISNSDTTLAAIIGTLVSSERDFAKAIAWANEFEIQEVLIALGNLSSEIVPWHFALKSRFRDYLIAENFVKTIVKLQIPFDFIFRLVDVLNAYDFYEKISYHEFIKNEIVPLLSSEFLRSGDDRKVKFLLTCDPQLRKLCKTNLETLFDLLSSQSLEIQDMSYTISKDLNYLEKVWVRMIESQLPLVVEYAKTYILSKTGNELTAAVLICLDSAVASTRQIGLTILNTEHSRLNIEKIYVGLAEHSDPYLAALVAARAIDPGIADSIALDGFDRRHLLSIRTGRKAKELIKKRRLLMIQRGQNWSTEFISTLDELSKFGTQQDIEWAIEMLSFGKAAETSELTPVSIHGSN